MNTLYETYEEFVDDEQRNKAENKLKEALSRFDEYAEKCKTESDARYELEKWLEENKGDA